MTEEDMRQELWMKLIKLDQEKIWFRSLDHVSQRRHAYTALERKAIDIQRFYSRRKDTSDYCFRLDSSSEQSTQESEKILNEEVLNLSLYFNRNMENYNYIELTNVILAWAKNQNKQVYTFAKEFIKPSPKTCKKWKTIEKTTRYRRYKYDKDGIPPKWLCKILGFENSVWTEFQEGCTNFLKSSGYSN